MLKLYRCIIDNQYKQKRISFSPGICLRIFKMLTIIFKYHVFHKITSTTRRCLWNICLCWRYHCLGTCVDNFFSKWWQWPWSRGPATWNANLFNVLPYRNLIWKYPVVSKCYWDEMTERQTRQTPNFPSHIYGMEKRG